VKCRLPFIYLLLHFFQVPESFIFNILTYQLCSTSCSAASSRQPVCGAAGGGGGSSFHHVGPVSLPTGVCVCVCVVPLRPSRSASSAFKDRKYSETGSLLGAARRTGSGRPLVSGVPPPPPLLPPRTATQRSFRVVVYGRRWGRVHQAKVKTQVRASVADRRSRTRGTRT